MNEVTIYNQISDPVTAIKTLGTSIARSQIFGCQNESQGEVLAMECMARRLPPLMLAERYHIIQGKLSMKSDAMLAGFEEADGEYEIKEYSPEACEIIFSRGKSEIRIRITWEDAQREPWPWFLDKKTGQKVLKETWASPIGRQDLLWARVVSRGVRRLAPGVVCGRYTPEEIGDFDDAPVAVVTSAKPAATPELIPTRPAQDDTLVDAEYTIIPQELPTAKPEPDSAEYRVSTAEPCTESQVAEIKEAIQAAVQTGIPDMAGRVKKKLEQSGLGRLSDLSMAEADKMLNAIKIKSLDQFLDLSLKGHNVPN